MVLSGLLSQLRRREATEGSFEAWVGCGGNGPGIGNRSEDGRRFTRSSEIERFSSHHFPWFNSRIVGQMFLFWCVAIGAAGSTDYTFCFYESDVKECPENSTWPEYRQFKVSEFPKYKDAEAAIQDVGEVQYWLACDLPSGCSVSLAALKGASRVVFQAHERSASDRFLLNLEGESDFPVELHQLKVATMPTSFSALVLDRCGLGGMDIVVGELESDLESAGSLKSVQFTKCRITMTNFAQSSRVVLLKGSGELTFDGEVKTPVRIDLVNSLFNVRGGSATDLVAFDMSGYTGEEVLVDDGWSMLSMIRCLAYSKLHPMPRLRVRHSGFLEIPASNWPLDIGIMVIVERTGPMLLHVGGTVPMDILRAAYPLQIVTSVHDATIMGKVEVEDGYLLKFDTLTYLIPSRLHIGELDGQGTVNVTGWPPIFTVTIERFSQTSDNVVYNFGGDALFSFHGVPPKGCAVNVMNMWADAELAVPIDLKSSSVFHIGNKAKIPEPPLLFKPYWYDESQLPSDEEIQRGIGTKIPFICGDLLKCAKEDVEWAPYGPRGFTSGAAVYEPYCERVNGVNCSGILLQNDIFKLYKKFCIADNQDKCSKDAKFTDNWNSLIQKNAKDVTFEVFKSTTLDFSEFEDIEVTITGATSSMVTVDVTNVKKLNATGVSVSITGVNNATCFFFTNAILKASDFDWALADVTCDVATYKSFNVKVGKVAITDAKSSKITVGNSQVKLDDQLIQGDVISVNMTADSAALEIAADGGKQSDVDIFFNSPSVVVTVSSGFASGYCGVRLHGLNGTVVMKVDQSPITMIDPLSFSVQADNKVTFDSTEFDISSGATFSSPVQFRNLVFKGNADVSASDIITDTVSAQGFMNAPISSLTVNHELSVSPNSQLIVTDTKLGQNTKIVVNYQLNGLPFLQLDSKTPIDSPEIELVYTNTYFSEAVRDDVAASVFENGNVSLICGNNFQCDADRVSFRSEIINFNDTYSMLLAKCEDHCLTLVANTTSLTPPTQSPVPPLPTATNVPDHTKRNVIILTVTAMISFVVVIVIVIKLMNKKKSYENEKKKRKLEQEQYQSLNDPGQDEPEPVRFTT